MSLKGKNILLGITGSIAAYKSAFLCRLLVKEKAEVKVIMTQSSLNFIPAITLATLSKNRVYSEFLNETAEEWNNHVELALWADLMVIAPATANTMAKMANGICDNLLLATYFSARCPVYIAPAMDLDMLKHPAVEHNMQRIQSFGNFLVEAESGELASGLEGKGRMSEPENILKLLSEKFAI